jgi:hypothetical protein
VSPAVLNLENINAAVQRGRRVDTAWVVGLAFACPLLQSISIWTASGFGGGPERFVVLGGGIVALAVVLIAAAVASRASVQIRLVVVAFAVVTVAALSYWSLSGDLIRFKLNGEVASWQLAVRGLSVPSGYGPCFQPKYPTMPGLGQVSKVCPSPDGYVFLGSPPGTNLVYDRRFGFSAAADDCVMQISGPWAESVSGATVDTSGCPAGFHFVVGP